MTTQEKELIDLIHNINCEYMGMSNIQGGEALAKAIIAKYPQILAEPLEVEIVQNSSEEDDPHFSIEPTVPLEVKDTLEKRALSDIDDFDDYGDAVDFCRRYNLKIKW